MGMEVLHISFISEFVAKTWNTSIHDRSFKEFTIFFLDDFVSGGRDKLLLCNIRALRKHLSQTEQYCPGISNPFISMTKRREWVSRSTTAHLVLD